MNLNRKAWIYILIYYLISISACKKDDGQSLSDTLGLLAVMNSLPVADIVFPKGFPGSENTISGNFTGVSGDYTVLVNGVSATGIDLPGDGSLEFIMPTVPGVSENATFPMIVKKSGNTVLSKTVRYRPLIDVTLAVPNSLNRPISSADPSSFLSINVGSTGDVLFNMFGHIGVNVSLYYYATPTSPQTIIVENERSGAQFKKVNLASGTYIIEVKYADGFLPALYRTNITSGQIQATSVNNWTSSALCYERLGAGSTYVGASHDCNGLNSASMTRTGRCTYPGNEGITTRSYYISPPGGGPGFNTSYAEQTCTVPGNGSYNEADAIFEDN
ncbi:hypothetical protein [Leptospira sarikeiensis]|uniref:IPT/TIG domain-containing protein n=1 Tax=Leptospira sarikeiensis TaxID=2484943 RepID=A0A4R9JZI1_9LEPT|nr:hypothetical protein [Leptospira sarikeiensis]TGL57665.1 hypothetical protein EHQ64_19930 [Leptospira sarikeiensis]